MKTKMKLVPFVLFGLCLVFNSCTEEDTEENLIKPKSISYSNSMEFVGIQHNEFLDAAFNNGLDRNSTINQLVAAGAPDELEDLSFITSIVSNIGQPELNEQGILSVSVPYQIEDFLNLNPKLQDFQSQLLAVVQAGDNQPIERY
jgi:hypothetical protein